MSILEALQWANNKLKKAEIDSSMLDAEILLAFVLELPGARLFSHFADQIKPHQQERFATLIERRALCEPIAYLIGKKSFYGRDFLTNPFVLIPRPATETLIESALDLFSKTSDPERVLFADIGTGSGAIAITLAKETQTPVLASDVSQPALSVAQKNAEIHEVTELIDFRLGDLLNPTLSLFETLRASSQKEISSVYPFKHLLICANLPYLTKTQMEFLTPDVRKFEPHEALEAGPDGLEAYWRLFKQLSKHRANLPRQVSVLIEIDPSQNTSAIQLIKHRFPAAICEIKKDLGGLDRLVITSI